MRCYESLVLPTQHTLDYFRRLFSGCPFDTNLDSMHVSLNFSDEPMKADPKNLYVAKAGSMGLWYDSGLQRTQLILPLISESLFLRGQELRDEAPNPFHGNLFFPHMVIVDGFPPIRKHYKNFVNSISNVLANVETPDLFFSHELVTERELGFVPQGDFYNAMVADMAQR